MTLSIESEGSMSRVIVFPVRVLTKICIFDAVIVEACIVVVKSGMTIIEKDPLTSPILSHFSSVNVGSRFFLWFSE